MEKMLGVMIDCSRNAVMNVDAVKKYADIIHKMGYNTLMLYTEDTYEIDNNPCFGHFRGRYTKKELKELDKYITALGMELIPCIQTLAHLENMFKWGSEYSEVQDCDNILLIGEEKTYKLIEDMIRSCRECFSTKKIHIGMDEAYRVGTGKYQKIHGIQDRFDIINSHLHKVCDLVREYDFEPMIWSDMFMKLSMNIDSQYDVEAGAEKILEKAQLPDNISLVYWDYYSTEYKRYADNIKANKMFDRPVYFAGASWTWNSFAPANQYSMDTTKAAVAACLDNGVDGVFFTMWGDDGAECSPYCVLPSLLYASEILKGNHDMDDIKNKFFDITGCDFDGIMLFEELDNMSEEISRNQCKAFLYNDLFMGIRDSFIHDDKKDYYKNLSQKIRSVQNIGEFRMYFDHYANLCDVLDIKAFLGNRIRKAYLDGNMDEMKLIIVDIDEVLRRIDVFYNGFKKIWFDKNKPHGFDVQDIRIGGLIHRIKSCKTRLVDLIDGKVDRIPELEEPVLDKNNNRFNVWRYVVTVNNI